MIRLAVMKAMAVMFRLVLTKVDRQAHGECLFEVMFLRLRFFAQYAGRMRNTWTAVNAKKGAPGPWKFFLCSIRLKDHCQGVRDQPSAR